MSAPSPSNCSPALLPCPFCGGEAVEFGYPHEMWAQCKICRAMISDDLSNHVAAWNRRQTLEPAEVKRWKQNFIAFACVHAGQYGRDRYGTEGCMHYTHYDLLKEAGARMDDLKRCGAEQENVSDQATASK